MGEMNNMPQNTLDLLKQLLMKREMETGTPDLPPAPARKPAHYEDLVYGLDPVAPMFKEEMFKNASSLARSARPNDTIRPMRPQDSMGIEDFDRIFGVFRRPKNERDKLMDIYMRGLEGFTKDLGTEQGPFDTRVPLKKP